MSDLFSYDDESIKQEVLRHIVLVDGRGLFLVLEGYDELTENQRTEGSILNRLLTGYCLPKASIMVTSRPLASNSLCPEFMENVDQHIEVVGFNDEDIKSYVQKACQKEPQILHDLLSYISSNPFVSSLMYIPLQCTILVALYIEKWKVNKRNVRAPITLTQLYTDLLLSSLIRYISDHPVYSECKTTAIRQLSDLPSEVQEQVWKLSQLAAEGLEKRQFIFDSIQCDHMGLMQSAEEELVIGSSVSYCFLHLTLHEYLAALHWSRMGSEDMVRLVSETSLFPLDTLAREGITKTVGYYWPALYFLSGLTKLPVELLNKSLKAADDDTLDDNDDDELTQFVLNGLNFCAFVKPLGGKQCNPYFFQVLFESQSRDLTTELFTRKAVAPSISNPLECYVTAWCVANSDPTSQWKLGFKNMLILENFVEHFQRLAIGSSSTSLSSSFTGSIVQITMTMLSQQQLISELAEVKRGDNQAEKLAHSMSSLFPCLECLMFWINTANIPLMVSFLCHAVRKLVSLKSIIIINNDKSRDWDKDELPAAVCIPPLYCPSLTTVWLWGITSVAAPFIQSLILPNINTLTKILLMKCRPRSGSEFDNFCSFLCQSTSLEHVVCAANADVDLNTHERKQLASALEQIKSLKVAIYIPMDNVLDRLSNAGNLAQTIKRIIMSFYKTEYLLRRRSRLMCVITPMLIDSHDVSQYPVTIDMLDVSLDTSDNSSEDEQISERQREYEMALQTAAEPQDEDLLQFALILSLSIETAQDERRRREEEQQQALQSENEQGEKEENVKMLCSTMQSSTLLDLSEYDQSAENDQEKVKLKIFEEHHKALEEFHKDEQGRQEEDEHKQGQEEAAADILIPTHHSAEDEQRSERQRENEMALQTAVEQQDEDMQLASALSASIETAQDEQRRREEEQQQQQALESEGEKEYDFKLHCSTIESSTLLDLSEDDQLAENVQEKEKLKKFKEQQQALDEFHKEKQRRQEQEQRQEEEQESPADMLAPSHRSATAADEQFQQEENLPFALSANIQTAQDEQRRREEEQQQQALQAKEDRQRALQSADGLDKEKVQSGVIQSAEQEQDEDEEQLWLAIALSLEADEQRQIEEEEKLHRKC